MHECGHSCVFYEEFFNLFLLASFRVVKKIQTILFVKVVESFTKCPNSSIMFIPSFKITKKFIDNPICYITSLLQNVGAIH
jgi:hypothetical protein